MAVLLTLTHLGEEVIRRSTWYPVIGEPPSCLGGCQVTRHEVFVTSLISGASGGPGLSAEKYKYNDFSFSFKQTTKKI